MLQGMNMTERITIVEPTIPPIGDSESQKTCLHMLEGTLRLSSCEMFGQEDREKEGAKGRPLTSSDFFAVRPKNLFHVYMILKWTLFKR